MKINIRTRILAMLTAFIACACSGNVDPEVQKPALLLEADVTEVIANGWSEVTFTVTYGDEDVTDEAIIGCLTHDVEMDGNIFTPTEAGSYRFTASYDDVTSNQVTIEADAASRFQRHVCIMEFTGTWCSQCPDGASKINYYLTRSYKGKAFALAFHNEDIYAIPQEQQLAKKYGISLYPSYLTDMRDYGTLTDGGCASTIDKSLYEIPTHCAVSVECDVNGRGEISVVTKVFSEKTSSYKIAVYVVEDKVVGEQKLPTNETQSDYVHRHVVRGMLSSGIEGDDLGVIEKEDEAGKTYIFTPDPSWNLENLSIAVLAINDEGEVNNMASCAVDGGKMDYVYLK